MNVRAEVRLTVYVLLTMCLLTAGAGVVLLTRLGPAVAHTVESEARVQREVSQLLAVVAELPAGAPATPTQRATFRRALAAAAVYDDDTDVEATLHLELVELYAAEMLEGDPEMRAQVVVHLRALEADNHTAMVEAGAEAARLGEAGAWAMVILGLVGFTLSVVVARRANRRLVRPLQQLADTSLSIGGHGFRRCLVRDAPPELRDVAAGLNRLLDDRSATPSSPAGLSERGAASPTVAEIEAAERRALLYLMDGVEQPLWLVEGGGKVLVANRAAVGLASEAGEVVAEASASLRGQLATSAGAVVVSQGLQASPTALGEDLWFYRIERSATASSSASEWSG